MKPNISVLALTKQKSYSGKVTTQILSILRNADADINTNHSNPASFLLKKYLIISRSFTLSSQQIDAWVLHLSCHQRVTRLSSHQVTLPPHGPMLDKAGVRNDFLKLAQSVCSISPSLFHLPNQLQKIHTDATSHM